MDVETACNLELVMNRATGKVDDTLFSELLYTQCWLLLMRQAC